MPSVEFGVAIGIAAAALVVGAGITFLILFLVGKNKKTSANRKAEGILRDAKDKADRIVKNALAEAGLDAAHQMASLEKSLLQSREECRMVP